MPNEKKQGSRKAPRKHQAHWKDATVAKRQSKRREQLDLKAQKAGYLSWSAYETAVLNGTRLTMREPDGGKAAPKGDDPE